MSDLTPITWSEYVHILALSVVLAAIGTMICYAVVQLLP
jgi:hypothetical protein